ncbi:hypothetical protein ACTWQF_22380 [Streptomyces sp. 8N114]|uniref:hypothetical protein n=1 Tax=Streptomyces sp. 8N114 TaxID=3457419 RepID=UPI003FD11CAF
MTYFLTTAMGDSIDEPGEAAMQHALDSLDTEADEEHPDVSLSHESGWTLSAFRSGLLWWELIADAGDDDGPAPGALRGVPREEVLRLFSLLAAGRIDQIESLPWHR